MSRRVQQPRRGSIGVRANRMAQGGIVPSESRIKRISGTQDVGDVLTEIVIPAVPPVPPAPNVAFRDQLIAVSNPSGINFATVPLGMGAVTGDIMVYQFFGTAGVTFNVAPGWTVAQSGTAQGGPGLTWLLAWARYSPTLSGAWSVTSPLGNAQLWGFAAMRMFNTTGWTFKSHLVHTGTDSGSVQYADGRLFGLKFPHTMTVYANTPKDVPPDILTVPSESWDMRGIVTAAGPSTTVAYDAYRSLGGKATRPGGYRINVAALIGQKSYAFDDTTSGRTIAYDYVNTFNTSQTLGAAQMTYASYVWGLIAGSDSGGESITIPSGSDDGLFTDPMVRVAQTKHIDTAGVRTLTVDWAGITSTNDLTADMFLCVSGCSYGCTFTPNQTGWTVLQTGTVNKLFYYTAWRRLTAADLSTSAYTFTTSMPAGWTPVAGGVDPTGLMYLRTTVYSYDFSQGFPATWAMTSVPAVKSTAATSVVMQPFNPAWDMQTQMVLGTPNPPAAGVPTDDDGRNGGTYAEAAGTSAVTPFGSTSVNFSMATTYPPNTSLSSRLHESVLHNNARSEPVTVTMWSGYTGPPPPPPPGPMIIGINEHMAWSFQSNASTRQGILDQMVSWGAQSIRMDYAWATIEPTKGSYSWSQLDTFMNEASNRGLSVLLMLYWPPSWSSGSGSKSGVPGNYADFGNILGKVAQRYGTKLAGLEMWNEPDLPVFWSGTRSQFAALLAGAYPVAKAMAPSCTFAAAAPTYLGLSTDWFADMYTHSSYAPGTSYDVQAIHPYMSPADLPPDAPASDWSVNGIADLQTLRSSHGDTSPLWATEFGWSTHSQYSSANHQQGVTEAQHAQYTVDVLPLLESMGVTGAWIYTDMDMAQTSDPHERNFGLLRTDRSEKPVVPALRAIYTGSGALRSSANVVGPALPSEWVSLSFGVTQPSP